MCLGVSHGQKKRLLNVLTHFLFLNHKLALRQSDSYFLSPLPSLTTPIFAHLWLLVDPPSCDVFSWLAKHRHNLAEAFKGLPEDEPCAEDEVVVDRKYKKEVTSAQLPKPHAAAAAATAPPAPPSFYGDGQKKQYPQHQKYLRHQEHTQYGGPPPRYGGPPPPPHHHGGSPPHYGRPLHHHGGPPPPHYGGSAVYYGGPPPAHHEVIGSELMGDFSRSHGFE